MFAVVDIAGQQFKLEEKNTYYVPRIDAEAEKELTFDKVLLVSGDDETKVGAPGIEGMTVTAKVIEHVKDDKVVVFKSKRRKSYKKKNGHRQQLTKIEVTKIG